jgi:hypothetical protein
MTESRFSLLVFGIYSGTFPSLCSPGSGLMAKSGSGFDPSVYAPVAERIRLFWEAFPNGRISTRLVSRTDRDVIFEARVYRAVTDAEPAATGWAAEREGDGDVNVVACLENTETSAVGRALANLGFTAAKERPSIEEMQKVARARARLSPRHVVDRPTIHVTRQTAAEALDAYRLDTAPRLDTALGSTYANIVSDLLHLLERAERHGVRQRRVTFWRTTLVTRQFAPELLSACEQRLRAWLAKYGGT